MSKRIELVQRVEFIKNACAGRKVLHLGCTNYPYTREALDGGVLLHTELGKTAKSLFGFDADQAGLDILRDAGTENLYLADLEELDEVPLDEKFDVIIAGEIIEHLLNPGRFLLGIQRFMNADSDLIITTVNAYCALRFFTYGLRGKGGENEPVHPDHVAYYSYKTLSLAVQKQRLTVKKFCFYDIGTEHRPYNRWYYNALNDNLRKILTAARRRRDRRLRFERES
jgi:hypothetical protein